MPNSVLSSETDKVAFPFILPIIRFSEVIKRQSKHENKRKESFPCIHSIDIDGGKG